jgi:hypothetical protein
MKTPRFHWASAGSFLAAMPLCWMLWNRLPARSPVAPPGDSIVSLTPAAEPVLAISEVTVAERLQRLRATLQDTFREPPGEIRLGPSEETLIFLGTFTGMEVEELLERALKLEDAETRLALLAALFEHLATLSPDKALVWAGKLPSVTTSPTLAGMLRFWGGRDVSAARVWVETALAGRVTEFPEVVKVLGDLADLQPPVSVGKAGLDAALAAYHEAKSRQSPGRASSGDSEPVVAWASRTGQWQAALEAAEQETDFLRGQLHSRWAEVDAPAWLAWMKSHPEAGKTNDSKSGHDTTERLYILAKGISSLLSFSGPHLPSFPIGPQLDELHLLLQEEGSHFASEKGHAGFFLMSDFPRWLEFQPVQASQWVKQHQKEPWIDPIVALLATSVVKDDPPAGMAWAAQVKDETRRRETFSKSYTTWRTLDPAAADAWAADHAAELGGPTR